MRSPDAAAPGDPSLRLTCAILAAQVAALRDRLGAATGIDLLWRATDALSRLSELVTELTEPGPAPDPMLLQRCAAATAGHADIGGALDELAFLQAQRQDLAQQMAACVAAALDRLAGEIAADGARLSPAELAATYVSDEQRAVHQEVIRRLTGDGGA
jgi:hypothetical protein